MKKFSLSWILVFCMATTAWGLSYTGSIDSGTDGGFYATDGWSDSDFSAPLTVDAELSWAVDWSITNPGFWTYAYTFAVDEKAISHVIVEVSADNPDTPEDEEFTDDNLKEGSTPDDGIATYSEDGPGNSNPGLDPAFFGIKWNTSDDPLTYDWVIVTDRSPMWGDFYAKDGKEGGGPDSIEVYGYNTGLGQETLAAIADGNAWDEQNGYAWVLVPDSEETPPVPEPATLLLLGTGLVGLAGFSRKKFKK